MTSNTHESPRLSQREINAEAKSSLANSRANRRHRRDMSLAVKKGGLIVLGATVATGLAVKFGPNIPVKARGANGIEISAKAKNLIPREDHPYRVVSEGEVRGGVVLNNVVTIRDYVYDQMRKNDPATGISRDTVADLILAENLRYQTDQQGLKPSEADPVHVALNQPYTLPATWGVGQLVVPDPVHTQ